MSLKATFLTGANTTTVSGLYQWDYGRVLEIESADIGSEIVEVHFACTNMNEAIVRSCAFANGVGTVTIPDVCLEQPSTITAWVYQISGTQGHTTKTITLPIIARTRPSVAPDIPAEISNIYTELITAINEAVDALEEGNVTVAKATDATNANYAASAGNAATANFSTTAQMAQYASADTSKGTIDARITACESRDEVSSAGALKAGLWYSKKIISLNQIDIELCSGKTYVITIPINNIYHTMTLLALGEGNDVFSSRSHLGEDYIVCKYFGTDKILGFYWGESAFTITGYVHIREL